MAIQAPATRDEIIREGWAVMDRLYDRLGAKSCRGLDIDAAVVLTLAIEELERSEE